MRNAWLYALPLVLAAVSPMGASAAGREPSAPIAVNVAFAAADADAAGTTLVFKDALRPHGRVRGDTARLADSRACGVNADLDAPSDIPAFKKCMASRGWRFTSAYRTPASASQSQSESDAQDALNQSNADDSERRMDDDIRHDDEMNATIAADNAQAANDASNAAAMAATVAGINQ